MERRHQIEARLKEIALTRQQLLGDQEDLTLCDAQDSLTSALSRSERLLSSEKPLFKR
ncbi:unnamed protein product [Protopolystoma xenopodis]|uniref:Uncharacterized protein n=1 Tax=Protopolystoma xenopodis TaxID=117903 RepID=A0A448X694_9PLAT|nr:unnamed protein product [Protopolystoma xenopodis]